ncbi:MAG: NADH-quinone oxidoreductase subunit A [Marmoricola sp.]
MYAGLASIAALGVAVVVAMRGIALLLAIEHHPIVTLPFLSGVEPSEHALSRYHVRWYTASVVFLGFDIEMLFMYPWAVVVADLGTAAVIEMFSFLGALLVAVLWARREGAFRWV